jgi:glycine cleavage system H protein
MNTPSELRYSKTHEWARLEADGTVSVGITDHAQERLGDMVFVELPDIGRKLTAGTECAVVESVKAAADVYAPVRGEVVAANAALRDAPQSINEDPYAAWLFRLKPDDPAELGSLLDARAYAEQAAGEA